MDKGNRDWPIAFDDVLAARERLRPHLAPTPLRSYPTLDDAVGLHVLVKHENHNPTNSFKVRNGLAIVTALSPEARRRGLIAATRGNHGLGLAWPGKLFQVPVTLCVPAGNNPEKNEAMIGLGAEVIEIGRDYDEANDAMQRLARDRGLRVAHSTDDPQVIAGAATLTLEALEQAATMGKRIDAMLFAVGGGSQAVGAMTVVQRLQPDVRVFGVQAERASAIHDSWHAGRPLGTATADTFADGVATRKTYDLTFPALQRGLTDFVTVSESEIADAVRLMIRTTHNLTEGAGAVGLAGLQKLSGRLRERTVMIVLSGSNIDRDTLKSVLCGDQ